MKKLISLVLFFMIIPSAFALQVWSDFSMEFRKYQTDFLGTMHIQATEDNEVTQENGINIIIPDSAKFIWDDVSTITASSEITADGPLISASVDVSYSNRYRAMHIPVLRNFNTNETIRIHGMKIRVYQFPDNLVSLGVDIDGDFVTDYEQINGIQISSTNSASNITPPYPSENFIYEVNAERTAVNFSWTAPPDLDVLTYVLTRRDLNTTYPEQELFYNLQIYEYTDTNVLPGDKFEYTLYARDQYNQGDPATITVNLSEEEPEEPEDPDTPPEVDEHEVTQEERDSMSRLYISYKVRHEIKCQRDDSLCLWAKINLIYTQEILELSDVETSISDRDLYLLGLRIKWPEQRFQDKCVEADVPDKTCTALGRSLKRAHYFLERNE